MSRGAKLGVVAAIAVVIIGGVVMMGAAKRRNRATEVRMEQVKRRNLVAAVTASGKIDAKTSVDVSADITGRIIKIGVKEGDLVKKGQFLLQIDPAQYEATVSQAEAIVATNEASLVQARANMDQAERALRRAKELSQAGKSLISPEAVEQAQTAFDVAKANYSASQAQVGQAKAGLQEAKDNLAKTRLTAPMDGRVVRLAVEEGEVAVPGTFSRETGLLMTIADLSVILAKVQVDETDVIRLAKGDSVQVSIDAFPDTTFVGRVTKISNSAQLAAAQQGSNNSDQAVDYDVEVTLDNPPPDIRPDLSATARIVTATRKQALSIPIIALTVRDHAPVPNESKPAAPGDSNKAKTQETEGVFVVRDGIAHFRPVKVGIAGDEAFEVLDGVREGETIVSGPYQAIRDLKDGTKVRQSAEPAPGKEVKS
ncbi:MAG TPA: efflux RND transporter periplasmic adaptor subunit [Gemmatimonadales bacterium]|jgi:HlyD family secretion protein|nr:efflux RND transporter periplasmic adaptor subunit [Gemmatimonadales bacterium]